MEVLLDGQPLRLTANQAIGKGGEADVYGIRGNLAVKIFKDPNHPDLQGNTLEQEAARRRLAEQQRKLTAFPRNLPKNIVVPDKLVTDQLGRRIIGYSMRRVIGGEPLVKYSDRNFRSQGIDANQVVGIFQQIHASVKGLHRAGVVIGDFNDLNVLAVGSEAYFIDSDSYQFGPYLCSMFTHRFLDPTLSNPLATELTLERPYTTDSDWYAYSVMLMQSLLFVGPYGGVYRPKNGQQIPLDKRPVKRITIFHPDVIYPKPAIPLKFLSDDLLSYFEKVFGKDHRAEFPENLVASLHWVKCLQCGVEHMRNVCSNCKSTVFPIVKKQLTKVRGQVVANSVFQTAGVILLASVTNGKLEYLYNESDQFFREGANLVSSGRVSPNLKFQIVGSRTVLSQGNQAVVLDQAGGIERLSVESFGNSPQIVSNGTDLFWIGSSQLFKKSTYGPEHWGNILDNQTQIWVGPNFGFGYYRAGDLSVYFVFGTKQAGIRDDIKLPRISGQILDSEVVFSETNCWFMLTIQERNKTINYCYQLDDKGQVIAQAQAEKGDGSWLSEIFGKAAFRGSLMVATDDGVVRVEAIGNQLQKTAEFPDTEPFVIASSQLLVGEGGLYIVEAKEIWHLKLT